MLLTALDQHSLCYRFTSRSNLEHWNVVERIMRYLEKTQNLGLDYQKFLIVLEVNLHILLQIMIRDRTYILNAHILHNI